MRLIVEADGGSRGNPGPAGYGSLVRDAATMSILARRNGFLGHTTNNVAEYTGLIEGLKAAQSIDPAAAIEVRMDSKLVVEQVSGRWQVKNEGLKPLAREAVSLTKTFPTIRLTWVPRAQNSAADALANEAMDARSSTYDVYDDTAPAGSVTGAPTAAAPSDTAPTAIPPPTTATWAPAVGEATRLLLLRHGQTAMSVDRRFSGRGDVPLTVLGHEQARHAAARLVGEEIAAVVSSPLIRARETAETVATRIGLPVAVDDGWMELDFGSWEGLTYGEVRERDPDGLKGWLDFVDGGPTAGPAPHGGETFAQVADRVGAASDALVAAYAGKTVLVVSHVTPIKTVAGRVLGDARAALGAMHLDLCSLSEAALFADGRGSVRGWNETRYLTSDADRR